MNSDKKENEKKKRSPDWKRDEVILALDLYFRHNPNQISKNHKEVKKLSNILKTLPLHEESQRQESFRNENGVYSKLGNFLALDPNYGGKGLSNFSTLDKEVWNEFYNEREKLHTTAQDIISGADRESKAIRNIVIDEEEEFPEGNVLYRLHKYRERNSKVVNDKKKFALEKNELICEVCSFDFYKTYGQLGEGYIECHHTVPVSEYNENTKTKLKDLVLVCSNCHRMLHRKRPWLSKEQLKQILKNNR